jgi:hypothetical protein
MSQRASKGSDVTPTSAWFVFVQCKYKENDGGSTFSSFRFRIVESKIKSDGYGIQKQIIFKRILSKPTELHRKPMEILKMSTLNVGNKASEGKMSGENPASAWQEGKEWGFFQVFSCLICKGRRNKVHE